jgi:hypothetical protein
MLNPSLFQFSENVSISLGCLDKSEARMTINEKLPNYLKISADFTLPSLSSLNEIEPNPRHVINPTITPSTSFKVSTKKVVVQKEVKVVPNSSLNIGVITKRLEKVKLAFRAWLLVTGEGDRMNGDDYGETVKRQLPLKIISTEDEQNEGHLIGGKFVKMVTGVIKGNFTIGWEIVSDRT